MSFEKERFKREGKVRRDGGEREGKREFESVESV